MPTYAEFLDRRTQLGTFDGFDPSYMPDYLFGFQTELVEWAVRKGRAAIFADCGLGKTPMQLVWAENVHRHTGKPILIVTPLAVTFQTEHEAEKFGVEAHISRTGKPAGPITITNYDRLHLFDQDDYAGMVCDESSAIKSFDSERKALVTDMMRKMRYRLLATATAAPNDFIELGTSSEALGYLGYMDMLNRFFTNSQNTSHPNRRWAGAGGWRFKGHAEDPFWKWVASWARALRAPSDLGHPDNGFILPSLHYRRHIIDAKEPAPGRLFDMPAVGLQEQKKEARRTVGERCEQAAHLLAKTDVGIAWCELNVEGDLLTSLIPGAVQVKGGDSPDSKEESLRGFSEGAITHLVTKPSIAGWGLNWQHCNRMTFFPTHSYEQFYQAVRRCWRFGQTRPVTVDIITTDGGLDVLDNLERKAGQASRMFDALTAHMRDALTIQRSTDHNLTTEIPSWLS
jgi:hypothetical protein